MSSVLKDLPQAAYKHEPMVFSTQRHEHLPRIAAPFREDSQYLHDGCLLTAAGSRDSIYNQASGSSLQRATILMRYMWCPLRSTALQSGYGHAGVSRRLYRRPSHAQTRVTPGVRLLSLVWFSAWLRVLVKMCWSMFPASLIMTMP